ncbi:MAG: YggS family pyridoxal phosphate-dependent enzyme [Tidjanibacter sp.]|nr:YggS family pyridoxal phosphate-dependent enzyme [Tidjanibacter sp.]
MSVSTKISLLRTELPELVQLVAVSKTHPAELIEQAYAAGQRLFGENRPQEMRAKYDALPKDIRWQMIGHLQTNKVKMIAPFVDMIQSVDSERLLAEIDRQAGLCNRQIDILFEIHLANEESKSGWEPIDFERFIASESLQQYHNIRVRGLMTVATQTDDMEVVGREFDALRLLFERLAPCFGAEFDTLSMGMTTDWRTAVAHGSTMVRIGSLIFGERDYTVAR